MNRIQHYKVVGGLNAGFSDPETRPVEWVYLKNAYHDRRLGATIRRSGSTTENITTTLGVPLGEAVHMAQASASAIPVTVSRLVKFGSNTFYKYQTGAWASVTADANTSFSSSKQMQHAQIGTNVFLFNGRPARWGGASTNVERVGCPAPVAAITTALSGTGLTTTNGGFNYMWTYYNPTTGLESDWSPISSSTGNFANKTVDLTIPTTAASAAGMTQKRIYRTTDGGSTYFLLTTVAVATSAYADTTADASLGAASAGAGEYGLPPDNAYIGAAFNNRIWMVDAANPYLLKFSKPYIGSDVDLDYYPEENVKRFDAPITGLYVHPSMLMVFHPRGVSYVTGFSEDDFRFLPLVQGVGTLFANSIISDGDAVAWLAESGFVSYNGGAVVPISREIDDDLRSVTQYEYNDNLYVSGAYSPNLRQFLWSVTASGSSNPPWVDSGSGAFAEWENPSSGATEEWESTSGPSTATLLRVKVWGWSKELSGQNANRWHDYEFSQFADLNNSNAYPVFLSHPLPSSDSLDFQQEETFIGYYNGTNGRVLAAFKRGTATDDGTTFMAKGILGRLIPGDAGGFYRFHQLGFLNSYLDPTTTGTCVLKYLADYSDPQIRPFGVQLKDFYSLGDLKNFTEPKARAVNLYVEDSSNIENKILLQDFFIRYGRMRVSRDSR